MDTPDHILIVDDDAEIRSLLGEYLRKNGYEAGVVADGKAMWAALARGKVDLIVLDLMLPGEDGLTLCRKLRSESDTPVIMLTARAEETDRIVGLEMGADDYVAKPFSPRELLAAHPQPAAQSARRRGPWHYLCRLAPGCGGAAPLVARWGGYIAQRQ
jgi:two-component system OmpR family response regulator